MSHCAVYELSAGLTGENSPSVVNGAMTKRSQ